MSGKPFAYLPSQRVSGFGPTVWHEFSPLAAKFNAVNLGQGFPNFDGPEFVLKAAQDAISGGATMNQYTRSGGHPRLCQALCKTYGPLLGQTLDPMTDVLIGVGASETIFACIQGFLNPGDEVILIEPFFDIYMGAIMICGAVPKYVSLRPTANKSGSEMSSDDWVLDMKEFEAAFTEKTRLVMFNNPLNPVGKVFKRSEMEAIAGVVKKFPHAMVLSDEVYEYMIFDEAVHLRFASLPDMYERTVTVGSSGKTFSVTGWKIGWAIGPKNLIQTVMNVHQYIPFSTCTPLQEAVAVAFEKAPGLNYFEELKAMYQKKRDSLVDSLRKAGLTPVIPKGSYFVLADVSKIVLTGEEGQNKTITGQGKHLNDWNVCRYLTTEIGVAAIPVSAFYSEEHQNITNFVRFCFCKTDPTLEEAGKRLLKIADAKKS